MPQIEVRHLKLVKTISEAGSITKAAQKLYLTQPALSHQLLDLEERLETPLFFRTKKKMILTLAGKKLLQTAGTVLEDLKKTEREISKLVHGETGTLQIGTTCVLYYKWLPPVMKKFHDRYPRVEIELKTSMALVQELTERRLDMVITTMPTDSQMFRSEPLFKDEIVAVMPAHHQLGARPFLDFIDFEGIDLILFADPAKGDLEADYLIPAGIAPGRVMKVEQPEAALELVRCGFGVSLFPRWTIKKYVESGELLSRSISKKGVYFEWNAVSLKKTKASIYHQEFIKLLVEEQNMKCAVYP